MLDLDVSPILARKMEDACERRLYNTTSTFSLNDNSLLLIPRYRLSVFLSELKEKVGKLLQMEVKKYSWREAHQGGDSPTYQPP